MITLRDSLENARTVIRDTPTGGVTQGDFIQFEDTNGFALVTASLDTENENYADTYAVCVAADQAYVSKASGTGEAEFAQGDEVYYDGSNAVSSSTGNTFIGWANKAAAVTATGVEIQFVGRSRA